MRSNMIVSAALLALLASVSYAQAQGAVVLVGDEGIVTAVESDLGSAVVRGGLISRQGGSDYDPTFSIGQRWGDRVTVDTALDMERMHPERRDANMNEPIDFRARVGVGVDVSEDAAAVAEYSRSFHNETRSGRWMVGVRFGF